MSEPVNPFAAPAASIDVPAPGAADAPLAERVQRLVAALLDALVALPLWIGFVVSAVSTSGTGPDARPSRTGAMTLGLAVIYFVAIGIYQIYSLSTRGQSLGKRWMSVKIVKVDGAAPGFVHAVLLRVFVNALLHFVPFYGLVDVLMIFREDRRCTHDLLAGTRVVKA